MWLTTEETAMKLIIIEVALALASPEPEIFWMPRGSYGCHFIAGANFLPEKTRVWIQEERLMRTMHEESKARVERELLEALKRGRPPPPPPPPLKDLKGTSTAGRGVHTVSDRWRVVRVKPSVCRQDALAFDNTTLWGSWGQRMARIYWVETPAGFSHPYLGGSAQLWFATPEQAPPGQWIRLIGRAMSVYRQSRRIVAFKELATGKVDRADWGLGIMTNQEAGESDYQTFARVPDCPPGEYEVYLQKGSVGKYGWNEPVRLRVLPRSPKKEPRIVKLEPSELSCRLSTL